jgi:hypothetical protein
MIRDHLAMILRVAEKRNRKQPSRVGQLVRAERTAIPGSRAQPSGSMMLPASPWEPSSPLGSMMPPSSAHTEESQT